MANIEAQNNFSQRSFVAPKKDFLERNKLFLTLTLVAISAFLLGIQLMPYIYGGSLGHFHSNACGWPTNCNKNNSPSSF